MQDKIAAFREHVIEASSNPNFLHHKWFVAWHLEIVEKISMELCDHYPEADRELVELMAWLHDYWKILDFEHEYSETLTAGRQKLTELGFPPEIINRVIMYVDTLDK